jgi:hypothetical protein
MRIVPDRPSEHLKKIELQNDSVKDRSKHARAKWHPLASSRPAWCQARIQCLHQHNHHAIKSMSVNCTGTATSVAQAPYIRNIENLTSRLLPLLTF